MTTEYSKFESALLDSQEILTAKRLQHSLGSWKAATDLLQKLHSNCTQKGINLHPIFAVVGIQSTAQGPNEIICTLTTQSHLSQLTCSMTSVTSVTLYSLQCTLPNDPSLMIAYALDAEEERQREQEKVEKEKMEFQFYPEPVKVVAERPVSVAEPPPKKKEKSAKQASLMSFFSK